MSDLRLSIALCTYNGADHLMEQLESIAYQTRLPDELIIADDCSADQTTRIIKKFAEKAKFPVHLSVNKLNLGPTKNFEKAISICGGDVIVLSDQDDVWHPEKLKRIEAAFLKSPLVGAAFSDAEIVNEDLQPLGYGLWESIGFSKTQQKIATEGNLFRVLLKHNVVTGSTMAFQARFRPWILPIPQIWIHDGWIAIIIATLAEISILPERLIQYRQHSRNVLGGIKRTFRERLENARKTNELAFLTEVEKYRLVYEKVLSMANFSENHKICDRLRGKLDHFNNRVRMHRQYSRRPFLALEELVRLSYHYYSNGWHSFLRDIFLQIASI
jgi:glycosyltransferase involved in cell wall biosynthesis